MGKRGRRPGVLRGGSGKAGRKQSRPAPSGGGRAEAAASAPAAAAASAAPARAAGRSAAAALSRRRGTAATSRRPTPFLAGAAGRVLDASDARFGEALRVAYEGFEVDEGVPVAVRAAFGEAFDAMERCGLFTYDMVSAGGKGGVTKTGVTRTLVGAPGITYKYLGLRLFAHPWSGAMVGEGVGEDGAAALRRLGELNAWLATRAKERCVQLRGADGGGGRTDFNLTLVNRMVNAAEKSLRPEPLYELGPASVSWHADSGLIDFSTIGVYHNVRPLNEDEGINEDDGGGACGWRVALRISNEPEGKHTPAVVAELPSDSVYYLLDDCNHHHEHAVLASDTPNTVRHSSTHRVAREEGGCWAYLHDKVANILGAEVAGAEDPQDAGDGAGGGDAARASEGEVAALLSNIKQIKAEQELESELENEWLRQWWIQGALNAQQLRWWHRPIERMRAWHALLEARTLAVVKALARAARSGTGAAPKEHIAACGVLATALESRALKRAAWREREGAVQWKAMPSEARPTACPLPGEGNARELLKAVRAVRSLLAERTAGVGASQGQVQAAKAGQGNWLALSKSMSSAPAGGGAGGVSGGGVVKPKNKKAHKKKMKKRQQQHPGHKR